MWRHTRPHSRGEPGLSRRATFRSAPCKAGATLERLTPRLRGPARPIGAGPAQRSVACHLIACRFDVAPASEFGSYRLYSNDPSLKAPESKDSITDHRTGTRLANKLRMRISRILSERYRSAASIAFACIASLAAYVWAHDTAGPSAAAQENQTAALQCYDSARKQTLLADGPAHLLCRGANSTGPAQCYDSGRKETSLTNRQLFELCRCSDSTAPVRCFERASKETFLLDERLVQLCGAIVTNNLYSNCAPAR